MPSLLGVKIKELRRGKGLTLEQLAQATESSKSYMWEIENKDVARPSAEKLERIAEVLEVTAAYLIDASRMEPTEDVSDTAFYRKYQKLEAEDKARLQRILDALKDES